jgi:uncharacterized membrane protein YgcG
VAAGDLRRPTRRQRARIEAAVRSAEALTGLQICVYLGAASEDDPRAHAEQLFVQGGLEARPALLVLVDPTHRNVEVVTGPQVTDRVGDEAAAEVVERMVQRFAVGDLTGGVVAGVALLAERAGPGTAGSGSTDLPDLIG